MNSILTKILLLFLSILIIIACSTYMPTVSNRNVSYIYNPSSTVIHPEYMVHHNKDTSSLLFVKINTDELLFIYQGDDDNNEGGEKARVRIHYCVYSSFNSKDVLDSISKIYILDKSNIKNYFVTSVPFKARDSLKYSLEVITTDLMRMKADRKFLFIDKSSENGRQNFMLTSSDEERLPYFRKYCRSNESFRIEHRNGYKKLFIKYYSKEFGFPLPPYSVAPVRPVSIMPDSIWEYSRNDTLDFTLKHAGIYHVQADTSQKEGLTLFNFGENFPRTKTPVELLKPLRYLSTKKGYRELEMYASKKLAVDEFWLKASGNADRAKELIRIYYSRIMFANLYFTSHTQGWNTDRGMIYTVFGAPGTIYKSDDSERWVYGENTASMIFQFEKVENPYSDNHYVMKRNETYKLTWYQAVDTWRNGRVYSVAN